MARTKEQLYDIIARYCIDLKAAEQRIAELEAEKKELRQKIEQIYLRLQELRQNI